MTTESYPLALSPLTAEKKHNRSRSYKIAAYRHSLVGVVREITSDTVLCKLSYSQNQAREVKGLIG